MSKTHSYLPQTKAETVERRLEELINNKTVTKYFMIFEEERYWNYTPADGEIRLYPGGVEMVFKEGKHFTGMLHFERRKIVVYYDLEKEQELQKSKVREE